MKRIHALAFGVSAFFAMNCGSGDDGYGSPAPGSSASQSGAATTGASFDAEVKVLGHDFDPPEVHVKVGQTVRWTWVAGTHDVVSGSACTPDGTFASGDVGSAPKTFDHTFDRAGTFPYFCDPHCSIGMTGKVVVE